MANHHHIVYYLRLRSGQTRHIAHVNGRAIALGGQVDAVTSKANIARSIDVYGVKDVVGRGFVLNNVAFDVCICLACHVYGL